MFASLMVKDLLGDRL